MTNQRREGAQVGFRQLDRRWARIIQALQAVAVVRAASSVLALRSSPGARPARSLEQAIQGRICLSA